MRLRSSPDQGRPAAGPADKRGRILRALRDAPGISKTELARALGISQSTASALVVDLVEAGLVEIDGVGRSTGGRPPEQLVLNRKSPLALAIDLGETNVRLGIVNLYGELIASRRARFRYAHGSVRLEPILDKGRALLESYPQVAGVGIAVPGIVHRSRGVVRDATNLGWRNLEIRSTAERTLELPVEIARNTDASLLAEEWWGVGATAGPLLFVTVGSGIGVGIQIDGARVEGASGVAGEFGHIPIDPNGETCACGKRGCLETVASSRALIEHYKRLKATPASTHVTVADIATKAKSGDTLAVTALTQTAYHLGLGLVTLTNLLNPTTIVLGGEIIDAEAFILPVIKQVVDERALDLSCENLHIQTSTFRDQASLIGGAALALDTVFQHIARGA